MRTIEKIFVMPDSPDTVNRKINELVEAVNTLLEPSKPSEEPKLIAHVCGTTCSFQPGCPMYYKNAGGNGYGCKPCGTHVRVIDEPTPGGVSGYTKSGGWEGSSRCYKCLMPTDNNGHCCNGACDSFNK